MSVVDLRLIGRCGRVRGGAIGGENRVKRENSGDLADETGLNVKQHKQRVAHATSYEEGRFGVGHMNSAIFSAAIVKASL